MSFSNNVLQYYLMLIKHFVTLITIIKTLWQIILTLALGLTAFFLMGYVQIWFDKRAVMFDQWLSIKRLEPQGSFFEFLGFYGHTYSMPNCWELLNQAIWLGIGCALVCLPVISLIRSIRQKQLKMYS